MKYTASSAKPIAGVIVPDSAIPVMSAAVPARSITWSM